MSLPTPIRVVIAAEPLGRGVYATQPIGTVIGQTEVGRVSMECAFVQEAPATHAMNEGSTLGLGINFMTRNAKGPRLYRIDLVALCEAVVDAYIKANPEDVVETQG